MKHDLQKEDPQAQVAKAQWTNIINAGEETSRLAFLKEFAQNASQHGSKKWSWTSSTSREAVTVKITANTKVGNWRS
eukprot:2532455-Amphidinium_carterae.1